MDNLPSKFRRFVNHCLHEPGRIEAKIVNGMIVFLIIFSIAVIPLHFLPNLEWAKDYLFFFDKFTVTIFTVEYFLRIWSARTPWRYITSWWGIIDLVAIAPFYLNQMGILASPELFLILRILRILKLGKVYETERHAITASNDQGHGEFRVGPGEVIEHVVQKHALFLLINMAVPLFLTTVGLSIIVFFKANVWASAVAVLFFILGGVFFFKAWLDFNYDVIYITNRRIILQNRELFGSNLNGVPYEAVTNVKPNNIGIWHFLFGFGDICIETAAMQGTLHFQEAPDPHKVVRHITRNRQAAIDRGKIQHPPTAIDSPPGF